MRKIGTGNCFGSAAAHIVNVARNVTRNVTRTGKMGRMQCRAKSPEKNCKKQNLKKRNINLKKNIKEQSGKTL